MDGGGQQELDDLSSVFEPASEERMERPATSKYIIKYPKCYRLIFHLSSYLNVCDLKAVEGNIYYQPSALFHPITDDDQ